MKKTKKQQKRLSRGEIKLAVLPFALLGVLIAVIPLGVPKAANATTTLITSVISPVISFSNSNGTVNLNVTPGAANGNQTTSYDSITILSNDSSGYNVYLSNNSATDGTLGGVIAASSNSSPAVLAADTWGYREDGFGSFGAGPTIALTSNPILSSLTYMPVPLSGSPVNIASPSTYTSSATYTIWYSVVAKTDIRSGSYASTVLYTATTK
jgi:hypothetical protein